MGPSSKELWIRRLVDAGRALMGESEHRRDELERTSRSLEATRDVTFAIGRDIGLEHVLELIATRGRALIGARSLVIMLRDGEDLVVEASAGHAREMHGARLPIAESTSGQVLARGRSQRVTDVETTLQIAPEELGVAGAHTALLVPMVYRGEALGILAAFDRDTRGDPFGDDEEQMLRTFAASAATAVALAQSVQADRLRSSLAAAEAERRRWARELHDETLQSLGGLRVLLSSALRRSDPAQAQGAAREAIDHIDREIENLRSIITELRPAALDELGLRSAIEALIDHHAEHGGVQIVAELNLSDRTTPEWRLDEDLESTVYRLVQEALTNVAKHSRASTARVAVSESDGELIVEIQDDGAGFDPLASSHGFGLAGMRERVNLFAGTLTLSSDATGTLVAVRLPTDQRAARARGGRSVSDQAAS